MKTPLTRPKISREAITAILQAHGVYKTIALVGIRGYYKDTMGIRGKNDRGIFDDAIVLISPNVYATYNANVDPSRWGINTSINKPFAQLKEGKWLYKVGIHKRGKKGEHQALVQAAKVTVIRKEKEESELKEETGFFGINIHRASGSGTSSEGCQTIPASQWDSFINTVKSEMKREGITEIVYLLT